MIHWLRTIEFQDPHALWGFLLIPLLILIYVLRSRKSPPRIALPDSEEIGSAFKGRWAWTRHLLFTFQAIALFLLITALARPTTSKSWKNVNTEGIDIMLAMDISASMLAKDFEPNRIEAAKRVASDFIEGRPQDRIGLVVYEGESFTQCPLTLDHRVLQNLLSGTETGMLKQGTAIGMGLATAVNRLKDSDAKSKVIILLTDGVNNRGAIAPKTAADLAKEKGIRVHTIGVGSEGKAMAPVRVGPGGNYQYEPQKVRIDEKTLKQIAKTTNGSYFRATDEEKLEKIYERIDRLEKSKMKVTEHTERNEEFHAFLLSAGILLILERILRWSVVRSIP